MPRTISRENLVHHDVLMSNAVRGSAQKLLDERAVAFESNAMKAAENAATILEMGARGELAEAQVHVVPYYDVAADLFAIASSLRMVQSFRARDDRSLSHDDISAISDAARRNGILSGAFTILARKGEVLGVAHEAQELVDQFRQAIRE